MKACNYYISTDIAKLDYNIIHDFLSNCSYWAKGRSRETVEKSIRHSLCFGVYDKNHKQVGFARVVTDYAVFAWILDVFILEDFRGKELGIILIREIMNHPKLTGLQKWGLATDDAHSLYEKFGFTKITRPEIYMERIIETS